MMNRMGMYPFSDFRELALPPAWFRDVLRFASKSSPADHFDDGLKSRRGGYYRSRIRVVDYASKKWLCAPRCESSANGGARTQKCLWVPDRPTSKNRGAWTNVPLATPRKVS